jgi:hypothetical protein
MAHRKKVLFKYIILGDSGWVEDTRRDLPRCRGLLLHPDGRLYLWTLKIVQNMYAQGGEDEPDEPVRPEALR